VPKRQRSKIFIEQYLITAITMQIKKSNKSRAESLITHLKMVSHPEGGYYCRTYSSHLVVKKDALPKQFGGDRIISSAIYFLLEREQVSALHRLKSDEIWHFHEGSPLELCIISPTGELIQRRLGPNIESGEEFQIAIPAGFWFGARIKAKDSYSFFGCTVSPGFDFEDFELGRREDLLKLFPQHREIIIPLTSES
jgi:hypothetical protein